jgi:cell division protein ZapA
MTIEITGTTVEVLGKKFQVKCPEDDVSALQEAAAYLQEKMTEIRATTHLLSIDRIAVIAALNIANQLLALQKEKSAAADKINDRLRDLQNKMDNMIAQNAQLELGSAE